jgi:hypothetical protein
MTEERERLRTLATVAVLTMLLLAGPAAAQGLAVIPALDISCHSAALGGPASLIVGPAAAQSGGSDGGVANAQVATASVEGKTAVHSTTSGDSGSSTGGEAEADRTLTLRELRAQGGLGAESGGSTNRDATTGAGEGVPRASRSSETAGLGRAAEATGVAGTRAATPTLNRTVYAEERGDVVTVGISLGDAESATLTIGTVSDNNFAQNVTVTDGTGDDFVALAFNTYTAGNSGPDTGQRRLRPRAGRWADAGVPDRKRRGRRGDTLAPGPVDRQGRDLRRTRREASGHPEHIRHRRPPQQQERDSDHARRER